MSATRAQFLRQAGGGGLALIAGGSLLGLAQGTALAATSSGDVAIAKLAATAELLAIDFYTKALASKQLKGSEASYLGPRSAMSRPTTPRSRASSDRRPPPV